MTKEYRYISFNESEPKPKTKVFKCINNSHQDILGEVRWNPQWRQYRFS